MNFVGDVEAATGASTSTSPTSCWRRTSNDLTGQVVAKVVSLATELEDSLVKLLVRAAPPEQAQKVEAAVLNGPVGEPGRPHGCGQGPGGSRRPAGQPRFLSGNCVTSHREGPR